jgi:phosphatidylserine/phosphatidylglycerophosphate/cardiolipin synthase-like enzyme
MKKDMEIVVSLPPFDKLGMKKHIDRENIDYVELKQAFIKVIKEARNTIYISSPFFDANGISDIIDLLLKKSYDNVEIKILVREALSENPERLKNIKNIVAKAKELGVKDFLEVREYHYNKNKIVQSSLHAKFVIADLTYGYIGSGELRKNSIEKNFEVGILVQGKVMQDLSKIFIELWKVSEEIV